MFESFGSLFGRKSSSKGGPSIRESASGSSPSRQSTHDRTQTYSRVFRYRLPDGQTAAPGTVEVIGSFTHWKKVPMIRDSVLDAWHVTVHHIVGNRTHHYMLLLDGKPAYDKNCDGLAVPHGYDEAQYQLATDKGPRVFMLFAQAK